MTTDMVEIELATLRQERDEARGELATLRAALRRFKTSTQQGTRAEYLAAQAALVALAREGA